MIDWNTTDLGEIIKVLKYQAGLEIKRNKISAKDFYARGYYPGPGFKLPLIKWWVCNFEIRLKQALTEVEEQIEYYKLPEHVRKWKNKISRHSSVR